MLKFEHALLKTLQDRIAIARHFNVGVATIDRIKRSTNLADQILPFLPPFVRTGPNWVILSSCQNSLRISMFQCF